ncbi:MAG TPA: cytochrome P450 [Chloroflexota bacterium]|nr:cytochrome P450 [Chloroflexota bacterium]
MAQDEVRRVTTPAGDPAWLVTGYERVRTLLTDPRLGRSHPAPERAARYADTAIFGGPMDSPAAEGAGHAWMRRLLGPAFSARRMATLRPRVQALVDGLLDTMGRQTPPLDFHAAVSFPLPALVICELLGVPYAEREDFRRWSDETADMTDASRSQAGLASLEAYMRQLLVRKREQPAEDVLSDLVAAQAQAGGMLTDEHLVGLAAGLLFAGHETTVAAIDKGVLLLLTHPAAREAMLRDPALVPRAVEEILRLPNPAPAAPGAPAGPADPADPADPQAPEAVAAGLPRYAKTEIELDGVTIPAWDLVLLGLQEANLDQRVFPAPHAFDLSREPTPHLTFGHGPHFCLGAPLARLELQTLFGTLFHRFPTLRLAVPLESLRPRTGRLTGGLESLPVTW